LGREKDPFPTNPKRTKKTTGHFERSEKSLLFMLWEELEEGYALLH
jgi:hypothetical protein